MAAVSLSSEPTTPQTAPLEGQPMGRRGRRRSVDTRTIGPLPQPATPLVGREAELARVKRWLRGPDVRFVTLVGPPGTGKTRLAIATAQDMLGGFEQGVTFVDLTTLSRPEQVAPAIAHALEIGYTGRLPDGLEETLRRVLSDQHRLLVLDNCDRLLASAGMVLELVAACPHLKVLVTSREPMRVAAEHQFLVPPLAVPDLTRLPPIAELARVPAVRLFRLRVRSVQPGWELNDRNAAAVAELCVRLDGLPLAIELAASWMRVLSPRAMLPQLAEALDLLVGGGPDQPERHQTLRAAIAWSHDLLGEPERRLFRRLAVFRNGWTVEACAAVCSEPGTAQVETLKPLASLVDKHLVLRSEDQDGNVRFRLLETLHAFAQEQVVASGELEVLRERHATFFVDLAEQAERELDSPLQAAWLERLNASW